MEPARGRGQPIADVVAAGGGFYDRDAVRTWLCFDDADLNERARLHRVLALPCSDGSTVYPTWQFDNRGDVLPFLSDILQALAAGVDDPWAWALWLSAQRDDGFTAVQTLASWGDPRPVLRDAVHDAALLSRE